MKAQSPFKWRHFEAEIILLCVRWSLRIRFSSRDLEERLAERGISVDHPTISRWVHRSAPELDRRCRAHRKATTDSWRVDETYVKVKGAWLYRYRAVDSAGNTLEVLLRATRETAAAKRFFSKALGAAHTVVPRVITVDKNACLSQSAEQVESRGSPSRVQ